MTMTDNYSAAFCMRSYGGGHGWWVNGYWDYCVVSTNWPKQSRIPLCLMVASGKAFQIRSHWG